MKKNKILSLFLALTMAFVCAFCGISEAAQVVAGGNSKSVSIKQSQGASKKGSSHTIQVVLSLATTCIMLFMTRYTK